MIIVAELNVLTEKWTVSFGLLKLHNHGGWRDKWRDLEELCGKLFKRYIDFVCEHKSRGISLGKV